MESMAVGGRGLQGSRACIWCWENGWMGGVEVIGVDTAVEYGRRRLVDKAVQRLDLGLVGW